MDTQSYLRLVWYNCFIDDSMGFFLNFPLGTLYLKVPYVFLFFTISEALIGARPGIGRLNRKQHFPSSRADYELTFAKLFIINQQLIYLLATFYG